MKRFLRWARAWLSFGFQGPCEYGPYTAEVRQRDLQIAKLVGDLCEQTERADFYASRVLQLQESRDRLIRRVGGELTKRGELLLEKDKLDVYVSQLERKVERYQNRLRLLYEEGANGF